MILECQGCHERYDGDELTVTVTPYRTVGGCPNCGHTVFLGIITDQPPKSPEQKLKDEIREAYKLSYPNVIFSLTNEVERLKREVEELRRRLS